MKISLLSIISFSIVSIAQANTCDISTYAKLLYTPGKKKISSSQVIKKSDCPEQVKNAFVKQVQNSSGVLSARVINSLKGISDSGYKVTLSPERTRIINLGSELKSQFNLSPEWSFGKLKFLNRKTVLGLDEADRFDLNCELCHSTGEKNISLTVLNPLKASNKTFWLQGTVLITTKVLVPSRAISPSEPQLTPSDFKLLSRNVIRPEKYFTNLEQLVFYKLNKPISSSDGLKFTDLTPINLVSAGIPTNVILKSGGLILNGKGIPSQSGKFGEIIRLRNPKTKRMIIGKVIDFNKVLVDL